MESIFAARRRRWRMVLGAAALMVIVLLLLVEARGTARERRGHGKQRELAVALGEGKSQARIDYVLSLPKAYGQGDRRWPLVLFLHGSEQRGDDLALVRRAVVPKLIDGGCDLPAIVVSPQCPAERSWEPNKLIALLDHLEQELRIDMDRLYVTGYELGGYGTWNLACEAPHRFAAIAPICGVPFPTRDLAERTGDLRGLAIWGFYGTRDQTTWFPMVEETFKRLWEKGGPARLTVLAETQDGEAWSKPYESGAIFKWLLSKRRKTALKTDWMDGEPAAGREVVGVFRTLAEGGTQDNVELRYRLHLPQDYEDGKGTWPLVLFLPDRAVPRQGRGADADAGDATGGEGRFFKPSEKADGLEIRPTIFVSPEWPSEGSWNLEELMLLLDHVQYEFAVDPHRISVSGIGRGAEVAWDVAAAEPERFAALVPIDGLFKDESRDQVHTLNEMAIKAFHWDASQEARFAYAKDMIEKLGKGGTAEFTVYSKEEYGSAAALFRDGKLTKWLFAQKRKTHWPAIGQWIGHARGVFPPPRHVVELFTPCEYRYSGGRYRDEPFRYRLFQPRKVVPETKSLSPNQRAPSPCPLPRNGGEGTGVSAKYPLIVWLHGHGWEELDLDGGQLKYVELILKDPQHPEQYPFFVLAMQCPRDRDWFDQYGGLGGGAGRGATLLHRDEPIEVLVEVMDELARDLPIDLDRVTLFGISSGAGACWELAMRYPGRFAGIAPCGSSRADITRAGNLLGTRVWAIHSLFDNSSPIDSDREMVAALRALGGDVRFTEPANGTHLCWYDGFENGLLDWLLQSKRKTYSTVVISAVLAVGGILLLWLGRRWMCGKRYGATVGHDAR